jgi:hypothetical protein
MMIFQTDRFGLYFWLRLDTIWQQYKIKVQYFVEI